MKTTLKPQKEPIVIDTDDGKECVDKIFADSSDKKNVERNSRFASEGAVFAERFNKVKDIHLENLFLIKVPESREMKIMQEQSSRKILNFFQQN